ncbi:MAG TPA: response regulator transcription factor [Acidimicrobiales bacterium]|nr:response regulator transcription factor [Acidimicrobiales bacterium]
MDRARILLVEDDPGIASGLARALSHEGYQVDVTASGVEAVRAVSTGTEGPDLVLLDLGLPDADGVDVCRRLVELQPGLPVVAVTARTDELDVVVGLDSGAVDYVTKPFRLAELLARVRAHLRRPAPDADGPLVVDDLAIDRQARRVWLAGDELELRPKEYDLLVTLAANAGRVVTREQLMTDVWDEHWFGSTKTLDVHIAALRRKLRDRTHGPGSITTIRGVGYRLEAS